MYSNTKWIEHLMSELRSKVSAIDSIWSELGIDSEGLSCRRESLTNHLFTMLGDMYREQDDVKVVIVDSIRQLENKIEEMEHEMGVGGQRQNQKTGLIEREKFLLDRVKQLEEQSVVIRDTFKILRSDEEQLASRLDETLSSIAFKHVPNQQQLKAIRDNISRMALTKRYRLDQLSKLRHSSSDYCATLNFTPSDIDGLDHLLSPDALDTWSLSERSIEKARSINEACLSKVQQLDVNCQKIIEQIRTLAVRLSLDDESIIDLDQSSCGVFLDQLRQELARLEELRRINLPIIIGNCQQELLELQLRCRIAHPTVVINDRECSDEGCLAQLESEIEKWQRYYARHEPVFSALSSWEELVEKVDELEHKKKDPIILKNRGGILLKVDKEYKQALKDLKRSQQLLEQLTTADGSVHANLQIGDLSVSDHMAEFKPTSASSTTQPSSNIATGNKRPAMNASSRNVQQKKPNFAATTEQVFVERAGCKRLAPSPVLRSRNVDLSAMSASCTTILSTATTASTGKRPRVEAKASNFTQQPSFVSNYRRPAVLQQTPTSQRKPANSKLPLPTTSFPVRVTRRSVGQCLTPEKLYVGLFWCEI